jgi:hypothetical protein
MGVSFTIAACPRQRSHLEITLNNIYKFSLYLTGNTLHLRYRNQPLNAV